MSRVRKEEDQMIAVEDIFSMLESNKDIISGQYILLDFEDLKKVCELSIKRLKKGKTVINLEAPIRVVGDIHAQIGYLWKFLSDFKKGHKYLFLGDYVDRGTNSIECIMLLLCLKILHPKNFFLIRGNHESEDTTKKYGLYDECIHRYKEKGEELYKQLLIVFNYLPLAATISDKTHKKQKIFCIHGGLSPNFTKISQLEQIQLPQEVPNEGLIRDILWADPDDKIEEYAPNPQRGGEYVFGVEAVNKFLKENNVIAIFRAHQVVKYGYEYPFLNNYNNKNLLTIFSSPNYCDRCGNNGAMATVKEDLNTVFTTVEPCLFNI